MSKKKHLNTKIEKDPILGLMEFPFEYLKTRALEEDLPWEFEIEFFVTAFKEGIRGFLNTYISCFLFPCE